MCMCVYTYIYIYIYTHDRIPYVIPCIVYTCMISIIIMFMYIYIYICIYMYRERERCDIKIICMKLSTSCKMTGRNKKPNRTEPAEPNRTEPNRLTLECLFCRLPRGFFSPPAARKSYNTL